MNEFPPNTSSQWRDSIYDQLHRLAVVAVAREKSGHSLQPTMLVNDAWLKLRDQHNIDVCERAEILAAGANIIRRLLVDYARKRKAEKRGGSVGRGKHLDISVADDANQMDILELHDALSALRHRNERASRIVELRFFGGLTGEEIAQHLKISPGTVKNDWRFAKAWLYRELSAKPDDDGSSDASEFNGRFS